MHYTLSIIPGTKPFVLHELTAKFPHVHIQEGDDPRTISFDSTDEDVDTFTTLRSALRIEKENGIIRNLYRQSWRVHAAPAGINPALVYCLCFIAGIDATSVVLDPFCGAGTIPIIAGLHFSPARVIASDVKGKMIDWTIENAQKAGLHPPKFTAFRSNVSQLRLQKKSVTHIVSNLPFGMRVGDHQKNIQAYEQLAQKAAVILQPEGTLVLYTQEKELIRQSFASDLFSIDDEIQVEVSNLFPTIFVIQRL